MTDDNSFHLGARIRYLEKTYLNSYILISKILLLKPQEISNQNKLQQFRETFKTMPPPELTLDDQRETADSILSSTVQSLKENLDSAKFIEIYPIIEKLYTQILKYSQGKILNVLSPAKPKISRISKSKEKKVIYTVKESQRMSTDKLTVPREMTPKRPPSQRPSVSPTDKKLHYLSNENQELRSQVLKITEERDFLKAWKENMLKMPNSLSEEYNSQCKHQEQLIRQLVISNKVLVSKLQAVALTAFNFIHETSSFQKGVREKESYLSLNFYETEKSKLKVKLEELTELKDIQMFLYEFPFLSENGSIDFYQFTDKYLNIQSENKSLRLQVKNLARKIKGFENRSPDKSFVSERGSPEKMVRDSDTLKKWMTDQVKEQSAYFCKSFEVLNRKLNEKEKNINELKLKIGKINDTALWKLKNEMKNSVCGNTESLQGHVKSLELLIEENKQYKNKEITELTEEVSKLEQRAVEKDEVISGLQKENWELKNKILSLLDVEDELHRNELALKDLESQNQSLGRKVKEYKQKEIDLEQWRYEKNILELKVQKMNEESEKKEKEILDLQQNCELDRIRNHSVLEEKSLKITSTQKEMELMRIELETLHTQITVLENINEDLEKRVRG